MSDEAPPPTRPPDRPRRRVVREVAVVFVASLAVLGLLAILRPLSGFVRQNVLVFVAAVFLYLPLAVLRRRDEDPAALGITAARPGRQVLAALVVCAVVFPPFVAAYHVWHGWLLGHTPTFAGQRLRQWPDAWVGRPQPLQAGDRVRVWIERDRLFALRPPEAKAPSGPVRVTLQADAGPARAQRLLVRGDELRRQRPLAPVVRLDPQGTVTCRLAPAQGCSRPVAGAGSVRVAVFPPGAGDEVIVGPWDEREPAPVEASRSLWWLLVFAVVQLGLVAIPEELFYRGYVQSRLNEVFGRPWRLWGARWGPAVPVTAALFAVGHLVLDARPQRLAVFFPALLFGWLRERTGTIGAAAGVHTLSNLLTRILGSFYY